MPTLASIHACNAAQASAGSESAPLYAWCITCRSTPAASYPACSDAKAKAEKRNQYSRHYAFKGRGRKEHLRGDVKMDRCELVPARN